MSKMQQWLAGGAWAAVTIGWAGLAAAAPAPTKDVRVVNTTKEPVPVRTVDVAFHNPFALNFADGEDLATATYQVPAGKRLVIEYASMSAYLPPDAQTMYVRIVTTTNNGYGVTDAFHTLHVQKREDFGVLKQFEAAHTVRIYANPGTSVRVSMGRTPYNGTATATVTLSGRLESAP